VLEGVGSDKHTSLPQLGFDIEVLEATGDNPIRPVLAKFMKIPQIFLNTWHLRFPYNNFTEDLNHKFFYSNSNFCKLDPSRCVFQKTL
jgi:hypothetical protein